MLSLNQWSWITVILSPLLLIKLLFNLLFLGTFVEAVVVDQLHSTLEEADYLNIFQSGFRPGYGVETAFVVLLDDQFWDLDGGEYTLLGLVGLAFDTFNCGILLDHLSGLGVGGIAV